MRPENARMGLTELLGGLRASPFEILPIRIHGFLVPRDLGLLVLDRVFRDIEALDPEGKCGSDGDAGRHRDAVQGDLH